MKNLDIVLCVEVWLNGIFLLLEMIQGVGGLLVGIVGKGMLMFFGGIDLLVVGYFGMKCGVDMEMVYFFSLLYMSEQVLVKVKQLVLMLVSYFGSVKFIQILFIEI